MKKNGAVLTALMLAASLLLAGCGAAQTSTQESPAEGEEPLLEPSAAAAGWEKAARRNLYVADTYPTSVSPAVSELSFQVDVTLEQFDVYMGDSVQKGDVLVHADTQGLEDSIEELQEQIRDMEKEQQKYVERTEEDLFEPEGEARRLKEIVEKLEESEPEMYAPVVSGGDSAAEGAGSGSDGTEGAGNGSSTEGAGSGSDGAEGVGSGSSTEGAGSGSDGAEGAGNGSSTEGAGSGSDGAEGAGNGSSTEGAGSGDGEENWSEEYRKWDQEYYEFNGKYRILDHRNNMTRQQLEQDTALYELDHAYLLGRLKRLQDTYDQYTLVSDADGEVVSMTTAMDGSRLAMGDPVIAIGNPEIKMVECPFISSSVISKAVDFYATINGKRYELSYQTDRKLSGYTSFEILDEAGEVKLGDYAAVTLLKEYGENVLSVPESAIHHGVTGDFVYVKKGNETETVNVTVGMSDGLYTEILSGLSEGDEVQLETPTEGGKGTVVLEKGNFSGSYAAEVSFTYPFIHQVYQETEYGTVHMEGFEVNRYEIVQEGDVIARISVTGDTIGMQRRQTQLNRLEERLQDLIAEDNEANEDLIEDRQEQIADLEEEIRDMEASYGKTEILAPCTGIILELGGFAEGDEIAAGASVAVIADVENAYLMMPDPQQWLNYGNEVTITYQKDGTDQEVAGKVVSITDKDAGAVYIKPAQGAMADMTQVVVETGWSSREQFLAHFGVTAQVRKMDQVVLVPREAVRTSGKLTYVTVLEKDGSMVARSFLAGDYNDQYYWVVEGLTEGTTVCLR